ncbi:MAG: homoserine kinase [Tissierellia bacterium]|nr:homoserine kinase [Tissierellia bacterium]
MIKIRVPGTTANLGPAFDAGGLALALYNTFSFYEEEGPSPYGEDNLIFTSAKALYDRVGADISSLRFEVEAEVPSSRGLGSSATCIIGGLFGANEVLGRPLDQEELLEMATEIEGHPDNVAPALYGGCVFSLSGEKGVASLKIEGLRDLVSYVAIPDFEVSTAHARAALPESLTYSETVHNIASMPFLMEGLRQSNLDLILLGTQDQIHEPYRKDLIAGYETMKGLEDHFKGRVLISGSGPTLLFITDQKKEEVERTWEALGQKTGAHWDILCLDIDHEGAKRL